jgi:uncharacterized protein YeaO (DUF488 family)
MSIELKRACDQAAETDGYRAGRPGLAAGIAKDDLGVDVWLKELAPSTALRKWFGHDPTRFKERYARELERATRPESQSGSGHPGLRCQGQRA